MKAFFDFLAMVVGFTLLAAVLVSPIACTMREDQLIAEAIKNGTDPLEAKCAIGINNGPWPCRDVLVKREQP